MWIKNILSALKSQPNTVIVECKTIEKHRSKIQTVDVFGSEPWLKKTAEYAIKNLQIPWSCSQEKIDEAKGIALRAVFAGTDTKKYAGTLSPSIFKTKREAQHAMAKIFICACSAVSKFREEELGLTKFRWNYVEPQLCDFPEHKNYNKKNYTYKNGAKGDWPGKYYGCRCWSQPIFDD